MIANWSDLTFQQVLDCEHLLMPQSRAEVVFDLADGTLDSLPAVQAMKYMADAEEALKDPAIVAAPKWVTFKGKKVELIDAMELPFGCFEDIKTEANFAAETPEEALTHALEATACGLLGCYAIQYGAKYDTKDVYGARLEVAKWKANEVSAIANFFFLRPVMSLLGMSESLKVPLGSPKMNWLRATVNWARDSALFRFSTPPSGTTSWQKKVYLPLPQDGYFDASSTQHIQTRRLRGSQK